MNGQEFTMYHNSTSVPVRIKLQQEDEVYFVSINGDFLGSMAIDLDAEFGFTTDDEDLRQYIEGISMHLRDETEKCLLALKLMNRYGENLVSYQFTNDGVLELIACTDIEIEEFGNAIRDTIYDDVTFESKLSVVLSKENDDYTFDFDVN